MAESLHVAHTTRTRNRNRNRNRVLVFDKQDFDRTCKLIYAYAGIKISPYKTDMVYSRLVRRLRAHELDRFSDYLDLVEADPGAESQAFINALTTNLTSFFRESHHFGALAAQLRAARQIADGARGGSQDNLLIWCCAASTGEEAYSLAITACEAFDTLSPPVRILATDIDTHVLQIAARGVYPIERIDAIDASRKRAFFQRGSGVQDGQCRVRPELQALIEFRPLNLSATDYGLRAGTYSAVFCRNVMIYFDKSTQKHVLERITPLLTPTGRLYAGHSESFNHAMDLVTSCGRTIYRATTPEER